jgi:hypothetical protein
MSLIAHAALEGNLRQGEPRGQHQFLSSSDALLHNVGTRGLSESLPKGAEEMARAKPHDTGEISSPDTRVQFVLDVRSYKFGLPERETDLTRALRRFVPSEAKVDSQQCRGALDATFCRATVGVQRDGCGNQKARQRFIAIGRYRIQHSAAPLDLLACARWTAACVDPWVLWK